jgi:lipoprotein-anchoring transpeptidase ErfK/SrfK
MSRFFLRLTQIFVCIATLLVLAACEENQAGASQYMGGVYGPGAVASSAPQDSVSYWDGDGVPGKPSIKIKLSEQRAYFFKGGDLVGVSQLSTGREGLNTPTGSYKIIQKDKDHVSNLYGDYVDDAGNVVKANVSANKDPRPAGAHFKGAPMPYFMRVTGGVGMHAGYLPGYPASHGCIRMPEFMAENFFQAVQSGTPVTVAH